MKAVQSRRLTSVFLRSAFPYVFRYDSSLLCKELGDIDYSITIETTNMQ